jgi:hypothetical protein
MRFLQNAVFPALKRVQLFLDKCAAVLAVIVDLTAAQKPLDAVFASFSDHAYNQDANDSTPEFAALQMPTSRSPQWRPI